MALPVEFHEGGKIVRELPRRTGHPEGESRQEIPCAPHLPPQFVTLLLGQPFEIFLEGARQGDERGPVDLLYGAGKTQLPADRREERQGRRPFHETRELQRTAAQRGESPLEELPPEGFGAAGCDEGVEVVRDLFPAEEDPSPLPAAAQEEEPLVRAAARSPTGDPDVAPPAKEAIPGEEKPGREERRGSRFPPTEVIPPRYRDIRKAVGDGEAHDAGETTLASSNFRAASSATAFAVDIRTS